MFSYSLPGESYEPSCKVTSLTKKKGMVQGLPAFSIENEKEYDLKAKVVINATGEVVWAVRNEMARTVEDFLSRRTRNLLPVRVPA